MLNGRRQYHLPANSQKDEETKMNQASQRCLIVPDFQRHGPLQGPHPPLYPCGRRDLPLVPGFTFLTSSSLRYLWEGSGAGCHFQYMLRKFYEPQLNLIFFFLSPQSRPFNSFLDYNPGSTEAVPLLSHRLLELFVPGHLGWGALPQLLLYCGGVPFESEATSLRTSLLQC